MIEGLAVCRSYVFFFSSRRRHTRFDCDWSSDVCSSDLIERGAAQVHERAVREHHLQTEDVRGGEAVLEAVGAPRVLGDVAADGAALLRGRVRGIEVVGRDGLGHTQVEHTRLHHDPGVRDVDVQDAIHPRQADHDAVRDRQGTAGEPRARAARDEGNARFVADANDGLNLLRRGGQHDGGWDHAEIREAVALIGAQLLRLGEQPVAAHDGPKPVQDAGVHHFTIVNPCGTAAGKTYAYSNTITPTTAPSATECQNTHRKIVPSFPT